MPKIPQEDANAIQQMLTTATGPGLLELHNLIQTELAQRGKKLYDEMANRLNLNPSEKLRIEKLILDEKWQAINQKRADVGMSASMMQHNYSHYVRQSRCKDFAKRLLRFARDFE